MLDVVTFRDVIDSLDNVENLKMVANSILDEYEILNKEYYDLEMQKIEMFMPIIENIVVSNAVTEDIQALKRVVSSLKSNYVKCLEEVKRLRTQIN